MNDFIEFNADIGFDKFNSLVDYFGINESTGELKGCSYDYKTGIATFSTKLLPFIYDYFTENNIDTSILSKIAKKISFEVPIDVSLKTIDGKGKTVQRINDNIITLRDEQYEYVKKICKRPYGLVSLYTGLGKGMLIS